MGYEDYLNYLYRKKCLEQEKETIERRITGDKKNMAKDIAIIGGCAVITGASIFGICYLGHDIINAYLNDEVIRASFRIKEGLFGTSISGAIAGGFITIPSVEKLKYDFESYKVHKGQLKMINTKIENEKEKVLTR